jgi:Tfp pilus assembly pilus retraction ATPase PilT
MAVLRVIPFDIPTFEALRLPLSWRGSRSPSAWCWSRVTGSGKIARWRWWLSTSTGKAHHRWEPDRILHRDVHCSITQRQSAQTRSVQPVRAALREDPT